MNNFPYFNHFVAKIILRDNFEFKKEKIEELAEKIINKLSLNVVKESEFLFTNDGLTKVYVLSQSHMIIHTWPELKAVHIDLMTCSEGVNGEKIKEVLENEEVEEKEVEELRY